MGYVPPKTPKEGIFVRTETIGSLTKRDYVKVLSLVSGVGGIWCNEYTRTYVKTFSDWVCTSVFRSGDLSQEELDILNQKEENKIFDDNEKIGDFFITPPDGLTYKGYVDWYEKSILALIEKQTKTAIALGVPTNQTGKALTESSKLLLTVATTVAKSAAVGSALAGVAAVAAPIAAGLVVIFGALDAFGVFNGDDTERNKMIVDYEKFKFVLSKWYKEYAKAVAKLDAIDAAEFQKELNAKYSDNTNVTTQNQQTPVNSTNIQESFTSFLSKYKYYLAVAITVFLGYKFFKSRINA